MLALVTHQDLGERFAARAEVPIHNFQRSHFVQPASLLDLRKHVRGKLMGGIISFPLCVTETHVPAAQRKHDFAVGSRQSEDGVALMGIDMEVVCRRAIKQSIHMGREVGQEIGSRAVRLIILVALD